MLSEMTDTAAEKLVLSVAKDFFDSAPTYDHHNMAMAKSW